jgi:glycosyltransferase involved in cell wall biosynthesis
MPSEETAARPIVAIVYRAVFQYRRAFYERLRDRLDAMGIDLRLIYGHAGGSDRRKRDLVDVSWGREIENRVFCIGRTELYWQPCLDLLKDVDLVIVEQANKLLLNLVLIASRRSGSRRVAFWGHGRDFQAWRSTRLRDRFKRLLATRVDWWFAYTDIASRVVEGLGYPRSRITNVQNAIDTRELIEQRQQVTEIELDALRASLGLVGRDVCIFAGAMYAEKRLRFLLEACRHVRREVPDFEVIFMGAGPDEEIVAAAARELPWIHAVGPKFDGDKVPYFLLSKLVLIPGAVGLVVLDSFALEVPMVTTDVPGHGPEIDYLEHGVNGWLVDEPDDPVVYARAVQGLLLDEAARARLVVGCRHAATKYTTEEMVGRFAGGIRAALASG